MGKFPTIILLITVAVLIIGCSVGHNKYEEFMESALEEMENGNLEMADEYLKQALEEKPKDEVATIYSDQVSDLILATEDITSGNLSEARDRLKNVINVENGLSVLVELAKDLNNEMTKLEENEAAFNVELDQARQHLNNKEFKEAAQIIEQIEQEDLSHPLYKDFQDDVSQLKDQAAQAEKKETERIKAEERRKAEEERKAKEKTEREQAELEKKKRAIDSFKGYWLKDTMACHFADTYIACALAYSDFITHSEIVDIHLINDTKIEVTFEDNIKNTFRLVDQNSLELADGVYKRVTKKEANAIYDGYYELP